MLDAFKKGSAKPIRQQADELEALIATSREERAALSTMLTQIQVHSAKLATAGKSLQEVDEKAGKAQARLEEVSGRVAGVAGRVKELETIDARVRALADAVSRAEQEAMKLTAPDSDFQKHRQAVQQLSSQVLQTRDSLDALKQEQAVLDELRETLLHAQADVKDSTDRTGALKSEFEQLRSLGTHLTQEIGRVKDVSREMHDEAGSTLAIVKDVEKKLGPVAQLQEMSKTTEERMATLNALAEHVGQKIKSLENQKHVVERAVVESNRLGDMIWNMDVQITKLNEASREATRTEELIERVEKMSRDVAEQLDAGAKARESFSLDLAKLEKDRTSLTDFVRTHSDRIAVERKQFEVFEQRMKALQGAVAEAEKGMEALAVRERVTATVSQRVDQVSSQLETLTAQAEDLQRKHVAIESLQDALGQVDALGKKTARQYETLTRSREHLETLRKDIEAFYTSHAAAVQLREGFEAERAAQDAFIERAQAFSTTLPALEGRMSAIASKLDLLDEGMKRTADLGSIVNDLNGKVSLLMGQQEFVERVESRVNALSSLSSEVDRKLHEQIGRNATVESLRSQIDGVALQVSDAQTKVEQVTAAQHRLAPLGADLSTLETQIENAQARFADAQQEESVLAEQERRLADMLARSRAAAIEADERLKHVQGLAQELGRSAAVKDQLLQELARISAKQGDVAAQMEAADEQLKRLESTSQQLEKRRSQLAFVEKRIAAFEVRLGELRQLTENVDHKIQTIAQREAIVEAVRKEVESVHEISARSKADLDFVEAHRNEVATLRQQVDDVLASVGETEARLSDIDTRKRLVDEVQVKTNVIVHMLEDVRLNMESVGEHKAVMDHVMDSVGKLGGMLQEAQSTLQALQAERERAERIERGIRQLRAKTGNGQNKKLA